MERGANGKPVSIAGLSRHYNVSKQFQDMLDSSALAVMLRLYIP